MFFQYPNNWKPQNYLWYQSNDFYQCYVSRIGNSKYKIELYTHNGTCLQIEYQRGYKQARHYCLYFLSKGILT